MFDRIKSFWKGLRNKETNQPKKNSIFGETRHSFQPFYDGSENVSEIFSAEVSNATDFWGMEVAGIIFYFKFFSNNDGENCLVWMVDDRMSEIAETFSDMSQVRLEKIGEDKYCPTIVRFIKDCVADRYDRGALVKLYDHFGYAICVPFRYSRYLEKKDYFGLYEEMTNGVVVESAGRLIRQISDMLTEMENFDGLSFWDEAKVSVKEALPGARRGWMISKAISTLMS